MQVGLLILYMLLSLLFIPIPIIYYFFEKKKRGKIWVILLFTFLSYIGFVLFLNWLVFQNFE